MQANVPIKTITTKNGISLSGYDHEYVFTKIQDTGDFYEQDILSKWFPSTAKVVYDIGANIGNHSVYFATTATDARVFSFEPVPDNFTLLTKNILDNQVNTRVKRHNVAVGDTAGIVSLAIEKEGNLGTASVQTSGHGEYSAEVITIDSLNLPTPDFIKIDVEGFELHVLKGMQDTLTRVTNCQVWIEVDTANTIQVYELMTACGFFIVDLDITANNNILWSKEKGKAVKPELLLLLLTEERDKREYFWTFTKYKSRFEYEQKKAQELEERLGKEVSKYAYEQQKANELKERLAKEVSKYAYEQQKANELKEHLAKEVSKYTYEQQKANELKERLAAESLKSIHFEELAKKRASQFEYESRKADELTQRLNRTVLAHADECKNLTERVTHFKELAQKRASQFTYEQNKAQDLQQRINQLQNHVDMFENSRMITAFRFVAWRIPTAIKRRTRANLNKLGRKVYVKLMPYPRLRLLASRVNGKLKIYKNLQQITAVQPITPANTSSPSATPAPKPKPPKAPQDMNVAVILDEFSYNSFKHEFNAHALTPTNWRTVFENNDIDLFFCESAWSGADSTQRPWKGKIYASVNFPKENRIDLLEILDHCKKHNIPTAFWNKEDPAHYPDRVHDFVKTAVLFDHVFTTADECVELYEREHGHKSVHTLMFATQPKLFPPVTDNDHERSDDIVFAGSWYAQHPERCAEMEQILDAILASPHPLKIYDRHHGTTDPNHHWPTKYHPYIHPALPHDQMHKAYTESKFALNINTVTDSDTMFARRVFELMSSNTLVISNYSVGMEELFGDSVVFVRDGVLPSLAGQEEKRELALTNVFAYHTYTKRFKRVLKQIVMDMV